MINAKQNAHDLLFTHLAITKQTNVMLVFDHDCALAQTLHEAYRSVLTEKQMIFQDVPFHETPEEVMTQMIEVLPKGSLVVLIQSASFRMSKFRWRLELFHRGHMVIEHSRLGHNAPEQAQTYINSLTCDLAENTQYANKIIPLFAHTKQFSFMSKDGSKFTVDGPFEEAKPNLGSYVGQQNRGGGFPVGEVFSEPITLSAFNGTLSVRAYPNEVHKLEVSNPFPITFANGIMTDVCASAPKEFQKLLELVKTENENGEVHLREIGFGLNKHIGFDKPLDEVTAFERQRGLHFSMGMKHNIYRKKVGKEVNQRFHIDIFVDVQSMQADGVTFFADGEYVF